jgi:hypothetical protein
MPMRTIKSLAKELGYTERTFHRKLDSGDPKARLALRQEVIEENSGIIQTEPEHIYYIAEILERTDPDISKVAKLLAGRLETLFEKTPRSPWRIKMDAKGTEVCDDDDAWEKLQAEIAAETSC